MLGWAVRDSEAANCLAVESPTDCWRVSRANGPAIFTAPQQIPNAKSAIDRTVRDEDPDRPGFTSPT
jgi:hypothetical protein